MQTCWAWPAPPALAVSQGYLQPEGGLPQLQQLIVHLPKLPQGSGLQLHYLRTQATAENLGQTSAYGISLITLPEASTGMPQVGHSSG